MHDDFPCITTHGPDVQIILSKTTKLIYRNRVNVCSWHTAALNACACALSSPLGAYMMIHTCTRARIPRPHTYLCMYMRLASLRKTQGTSRLTSIAITWRLDTERYSRNVCSLNKRRSCRFSMQPDVKIVAGVLSSPRWLR